MSDDFKLDFSDKPASKPVNNMESQENQGSGIQKEAMQAKQLDCAENRTLEQRKNNGIVPRWKKGESGNPNGRPKGRKESLRASIRRYLRANPTANAEEALIALGVSPHEAGKLTNADGIAITMIDRAITQGDVQAARLLATHAERPLKTDQPETSTQFNILIPDLTQAREVLARRGNVILPEQRRAMFFGDQGESPALPAPQRQVESVDKPVDPMDELASFAV